MGTQEDEVGCHDIDVLQNASGWMPLNNGLGNIERFGNQVSFLGVENLSSLFDETFLILFAVSCLEVPEGSAINDMKKMQVSVIPSGESDGLLDEERSGVGEVNRNQDVFEFVHSVIWDCVPTVLRKWDLRAASLAQD